MVTCLALKVRQLGKQAVDFSLGDLGLEFGKNDVTDHGVSYATRLARYSTGC